VAEVLLSRQVPHLPLQKLGFGIYSVTSYIPFDSSTHLRLHISHVCFSWPSFTQHHLKFLFLDHFFMLSSKLLSVLAE